MRGDLELRNGDRRCYGGHGTRLCGSDENVVLNAGLLRRLLSSVQRVRGLDMRLFVTIAFDPHFWHSLSRRVFYGVE